MGNKGSTTSNDPATIEDEVKEIEEVSRQSKEGLEQQVAAQGKERHQRLEERLDEREKKKEKKMQSFDGIEDGKKIEKRQQMENDTFESLGAKTGGRRRKRTRRRKKKSKKKKNKKSKKRRKRKRKSTKKKRRRRKSRK